MVKKLPFLYAYKRILLFVAILVSSVLTLSAGYIVSHEAGGSSSGDYNDISIYSDEIPGLRIRPCLTSNEEDEDIYLFLPYSDVNWKWSIPSDLSLFVDGVLYQSGDALDYSDAENRHLFAIVKNDQLSDNRFLSFICADYVPVLSISVDDEDLDLIKDQGHPVLKENAKMQIFDNSSKEQCNIRCYLGGHGNSTWAYGKKPFEIKSDRPMSLLGLKQCSGWNLLANRMDLSNLKDRIVYEAVTATKMEFSTGCEYVNLYINGIYQGLYLLTEKPSTGDGIVTFQDDIEKENLSLIRPATFTPVVQNISTKEEMRYYNLPSPPNISGSYLMEFDSYEEDRINYSLESWFLTDKAKDENGAEWVVLLKQPMMASEDELIYIRDYVRETEAAIYSDTGVDPATGLDFRDRIDSYSWSMSYLFMDFFANHDVSGGSLFFYKKRNDPMLYSGPVWDYDKSMTDNYYDDEPFPWYGRSETILWYPRLDQYDDFHDMVVEDYRTELSTIVGDILDNKIPIWLTEIGPSVKMDELRWDRERGYEEERAAAVSEWLIQ